MALPPPNFFGVDPAKPGSDKTAMTSIQGHTIDEFMKLLDSKVLDFKSHLIDSMSYSSRAGTWRSLFNAAQSCDGIHPSPSARIPANRSLKVLYGKRASVVVMDDIEASTRNKEFKPRISKKNGMPRYIEPKGSKMKWQQPDLSQNFMTDKEVVMTKAQFDELKDYSFTNPTGFVPGKSWKRKQNDKWYLVWYGKLSEITRQGEVFRREIVIDTIGMSEMLGL